MCIIHDIKNKAGEKMKPKTKQELKKQNIEYDIITTEGYITKLKNKIEESRRLIVNHTVRLKRQKKKLKKLE